ncbi:MULTISPECIES: hypothetical protein [Halocynthiibacter]|uniref:Alpha 1,4-glycosyltransferase domain-containing protein n=1 Tax=Halocynthiibacter halioticoli TaxID=2986804 RepID=A0AAE3IZ72_9RHOB|nr:MULTISPECIES: hypothetical protein [Halocynthiibacter]MCV6824778.1 hypothetical protein [Halocynthiibacter halioticoli]MCW4057779.1 hypothetical protein [Halocynthiibacter sp. SDUM655004]
MSKPTIAMLWVEGPLSYLEQLCIQSFLDVGHDVVLYHYGEVQNVPAGVTLAHGNEILNRDNFIKHGRTNSLALFSDVFRYHLLTKSENTIWADTDAYCVKPFETETGHYFGWESERHINGGVLGLPSDSPALGGLLKMTEDEFTIPEWYRERVKNKMRARAQAGHPTHVSDLPWGTWGPQAVTHFLHKSGESKYAFAREVLYPVPFEHRRKIVNALKRDKVDTYLTENTTSIHLYGRRMRRMLAKRNNGIPEEGGLFHSLLTKHGIDPTQAPVISRDAAVE